MPPIHFCNTVPRIDVFGNACRLRSLPRTTATRHATPSNPSLSVPLFVGGQTRLGREGGQVNSCELSLSCSLREGREAVPMRLTPSRCCGLTLLAGHVILATSFRPTAWTTPKRHGGSWRGWISLEERHRPLVRHVVGETLYIHIWV